MTQADANRRMGIAALHPSYDLHLLVSYLLRRFIGIQFAAAHTRRQ